MTTYTADRRLRGAYPILNAVTLQTSTSIYPSYSDASQTSNNFVTTMTIIDPCLASTFTTQNILSLQRGGTF